MHVLMFSGLTWTNHILLDTHFLKWKVKIVYLRKKVTFLNIFSKLERLIVFSSITDEHTNCVYFTCSALVTSKVSWTLLRLRKVVCLWTRKFSVTPSVLLLKLLRGSVLRSKSEAVSESHRMARYNPSSGMLACGGVPPQEPENAPSIPCFIHRIWATSYNLQEPASDNCN